MIPQIIGTIILCLCISILEIRRFHDNDSHKPKR